ncbi:MAG: trypsin-like peptidase domain-containing protein, partial [Gemmatimonadota bacterium]
MKPPKESGEAQIEVLTGSRAGERRNLSGSSFTVGRDAKSDLQFDPHGDLAVSGRHSQIALQDGRWVLTDLGSLNGTYLNGERITEPAPLHHEARIQFGEGGPAVVFRIMSPDGGPRLDRGPKVSRGTLALITFLVVALVVVGTVAVRSWVRERSYAAQLTSMQQEVDSILAASERTVGELRGSNQDLAEALNRSRDELRTVRGLLVEAQGRGDVDEIRALRVQLQEAEAALGRHELAAAMDYDAVESANRPAVVKVFVTFPEGTISGTAFAVRPDGILLTNRHLLADGAGSLRPQRIDVQFADSPDYFPARVVAVSNTQDLAALKVDLIIGDVPTVSGLHQRPDTISPGQSVAVIGFPLGGANPTQEGRGGIARPTVTAGVLEFVSDTLLSIYGYGAEGASGSPVFDGAGEVIGVVFGGRQGEGGHVLDAVPVQQGIDLLD